MKYKLSKFAALFLTIICLAYPADTQAQGNTIFWDDFSGDLSKWEFVVGSPSYWQLNLGVLSGNISTHFTQAVIVPKDSSWPSDLNRYMVSFDILPVQGADKNVFFAYQSPTNWYELHFNPSGSRLIKVVNGQVIWKKEGSSNLQNGVWHHFELRLDNGLIEIFQNGNQLFSETDPNYEGSYFKPGLRVTTGAIAPTEIYFDNFEVAEIGGETSALPVPLFKQTDMIWGNLEYNSASSWAEDNSISAWGCALTSAAMIMQYHGFGSLPDGTTLNPGTLNDWLNNQPDGYIGNGLINWLAITRLSYILAEQNNQYALEYKKHLPEVEKIHSEIVNSRPVILQIPGHFLVGTGIDTNGQISINDPAYNYTTMTDHQDADRDLISFRSFTPSYTNLSYLLFVHSPEVSIEVFEGGNKLPTSSTEEYLTNFNNPIKKTQKIMLTELAKPTSNTHTIQVTSADPISSNLDVYSYNSSGNVISKSIDIKSNIYNNGYIVNNGINSDSTVKITQKYAFEKLQDDLAKMVDDGNIKYWWLYFQLIEIVKYADTATPNNQIRYINLLSKMIDNNIAHISPDALQHLQDNLQILKLDLQESAV